MRPKWTLYALLFSVAVNIAAVGVLIYYGTARPPARWVHQFHRPPHDPWAYLNPTEEQRERLDSLRVAYFRSLRPLRAKLVRERIALAGLALAGEADSAAFLQHVERISQIQSEMELHTLRFFRHVREVLSPEQAQAFQDRVIQFMQRGHRPPPPGKGLPPCAK